MHRTQAEDILCLKQLTVISHNIAAHYGEPLEPAMALKSNVHRAKTFLYLCHYDARDDRQNLSHGFTLHKHLAGV